MRIASISKSLTMVGVAKLFQQDKLCLDKPIQEYVSLFPDKFWEGQKVLLVLFILKLLVFQQLIFI